MISTAGTGTGTPLVLGTPVLETITNKESIMITTRKINITKVECAWCESPATLTVSDQFGTDPSCRQHADQYFPPALAATPVEHIPGVTLAKITDTPDLTLSPEVAETDLRIVRARKHGRSPSYPLYGHREGLRVNDMISLHSALVILAMNGGTAHLSHCDGIPGQGCVNCEGRFN